MTLSKRYVRSKKEEELDMIFNIGLSAAAIYGR
jgi:hypothetical protein